MASEWIVGLFTLGGTLGGALLGGLIVLHGQTRADDRQDERAEEQERRDVMAAARHVWFELSAAIAAFDSAVKYPEAAKHPHVIDPLRRRTQWERYCDRIGRTETIDFAAVSYAYVVASAIADALEADAKPSELGSTMSPKSIRQGMSALVPFAELSPLAEADESAAT